jgi:AcrR family transcriptional regulator
MKSDRQQSDPDAAPARRGRARVEGAKRTEILVAATERFGRNGYEDTKWADIASDVGVGPTALYHYFESKQHCLYVIMDQAIEGFRSRFELLSADGADPLQALVSVMEDCFELSEHDVQRNRVLVAEQGLLSRRSGSPREEEARQAARSRTRDLEFAWASFLSHAMAQGTIPKSDPRLLTRAILGLYNSVWHWYRPGGDLSLEDVRDFYVARCLAVAGLPLPAAEKPAKLKASGKQGKRPRRAAA